MHTHYFSYISHKNEDFPPPKNIYKMACGRVLYYAMPKAKCCMFSRCASRGVLGASPPILRPKFLPPPRLHYVMSAKSRSSPHLAQILDPHLVLYVMFMLNPLTVHHPYSASHRLFRIFPESSRWLVSQERMEEAEKVFRQIAAINNKVYPENLDLNPMLEVRKNVMPYC